MEKSVLCGVRVRNVLSPSSGREVANQFIINTPDAVVFQSYNSIIAMIKGGKVYLDRCKWDFSVTTGKYRNLFLGEGIADTRKKIEQGVYELADLN